MPDSEEEHIYTFGPSVLSTPARWRARFNTWYQAKNCANLAVEARITPDDYKKYAALYPAEGEKLQRMHNVSRLTGLGTALGFFGGALQTYRWTRVPPLLVVGTFVATYAGHVVADDIGTWVFGTYKFDAASTNEKFVEWAHASRQAKGQAS